MTHEEIKALVEEARNRDTKWPDSFDLINRLAEALSQISAERDDMEAKAFRYAISYENSITRELDARAAAREARAALAEARGES